MSSKPGSAPDSASEEFTVLIQALRETDQRLEELTHGEVDTVTDREGRSFLLRRAQDQLRYTEAAKQAAILNALPAHIAMIDTRGLIVSVNEAWRQFARTNKFHFSDFGMGANYLEICESAQGDAAPEGHQVAEGIRSVLDGTSKQFSLEYSCHSPTEERWFLMTATPLPGYRPNGAVVMHVDVTAERQTEASLRVSESRFRQMAESIRDVFFLQNVDSSQIYYVSPAYEEIWGRTCESLYANAKSWADSIHPDDLHLALAHLNESSNQGFDYEVRIFRPDGDMRWIQVRGFPIQDAAGNFYRTAGVAADITQRKQAAQELRVSELRFGDLLQNVELASVMLDRDGRITFCNSYLLRLTGWREDEAIGRNWFELFAPWQQNDANDFFAMLTASVPVPWSRENNLLTRSGDCRLMRWNNSVLLSACGDVIGTASIGEDITDQKRAETRIKRLNRVYAVLSGINSLIVRVRDRDQLFREACQVAVEHGHFKMAWIGVVDRSAMKIVPVSHAGVEPEFITLSEDRLSLREDMALDGGTRTARAVREKKAIVTNEIEGDTTIFIAKKRIERGIVSMATLPLLVSGDAVGVLALYADESDFFDEEEMKLLAQLAGDIAFAMDHIEKQERLDYLAYYDVLTGLANRRLFLERVAQYIRSAISAGHKLALFLIDLERFKSINDSLGQPAGDTLLQQVALWLTSYVGDANLLTRMDADHFAVVLPKLNQDGDLIQLIENTMTAFLNHPLHLNDGVFRIGAKVGVALFPDDGSDADTLFKNAEAALKKAKVTGERFLFYTQKMTDMVAGKLTLENQLRQALEREEFVLHYQPKMNLASGKVVGAEALIRWNDPRTGLVAPGQFIPILEETGLIYEVGRWAMHKAIEDHLRWRDAGLTAVRIAVNVSPRQLRNRGFIKQIERAIEIDAHAAAGLELEITESLIMEDIKQTIGTLHTIRGMGVSIAIDDFGTGFSSLSYLARLPVHTVKIDRSFIIEMSAGAQGLALVSTIISLAHSLKLKVVAEGVETEAQSSVLRVLKCDEMQGYLFSKPVSCDIFEKRFLTKSL
jgi:diguanylate cyclase (GGDEF)-like protein/PAS domain S-box-containing protein